MLNNGNVLDSIHLPSNAMEGHPVTVSAESLMPSSGAQAHPITISGGSIMASGRSIASVEPVPRSEQSLEYHPVIVTNPQPAYNELLQGRLAACFVSQICPMHILMACTTSKAEKPQILR